MAMYDVTAKEITYVSWIIEADTEAEAVEIAKDIGTAQAIIGDTELRDVYTAGEYVC